jgi:hypothetical protein
MPFGTKNATNTFFKSMTKMFGPYLDKFLKFFCGWFEYPQLELGGAFETPMICSTKIEGS